MKTYGILGYPLRHSFSKQYFTQKFEEEQIEAEFLNFELSSLQELPKKLEENKNLKGLCVTIPYKERVIHYLDEIDPLAAKLGAVNSIQFRNIDGKLQLKGFNTDIYGFMESVKELIGDQRPSALILGTGGASKAIAGGLEELGISYRFVSRNPETNHFSYQQLNHEIMSYFKLIVNCSPVGTFPKEDRFPNIPYKYLSDQHFLYDLVYNPNETLFLKKGTEQGAKTMNGLKMLHLQAERNWEIWTEK